MRALKIQNLFTILTTFLLMFLNAVSLHSATQNIDGVITSKPSIQWNGSLAYDIRNTNVIYQTRDIEGRFRSIYTPLTVGISSSRSALMIHGRLVSVQTFINTVEPGLHGHFYEDVFEDIYLTPDYTFGIIDSHNPDKNEITIRVPRTPKNGHYENNPDTIVHVYYTDQANFFIEDQASNETDAMEKWGKWIQVHPSCQQIIWLQTDSSSYDYTRLPTPEDGFRGSANSATGMAYFKNFSSDGEFIEVHRNIHDTWVDHMHSLESPQAWLDGKLCPTSVAFKPGREFVAACRRSGDAIKEEMVRTRDDEIRGTITVVNENSFTVAALDWDGNPYTTTINIASNGRIMLDGNDTTSNAIEIGREVRIFPERNQKRIVVLNERMPGKSSEYQPVAYFYPDKPYATSNHEFTFDASHSYDLDGTITSYDWDFGDGTIASGELVNHTFDHAGGYKAYKVVLTVGNAEGETATNTQYITVVDAIQKAENVLIDHLKSGIVCKEWSPACDFTTYPECGEPDMIEARNNTIYASNGGMNEYSGYINVPEDGWFEFRLPNYTMQLWIGDWLIIDRINDVRESWGPWNLAQLASQVYLEAGLHRIKFLTMRDSYWHNIIGWSGPGVYLRTKTVDDLNGLGDSYVTKTMLVLDEDLFYMPTANHLLEAEAAASIRLGNAPLSVNFNADATTGDVDSYTWIFGDGDTAYTNNPEHTFTLPGFYTAKLIVADQQGNTAEDSVTISVINPNASSEYAGISVNFSDSYTLSNDSVVGAVPLSNWNNVSVPSWGSGHTASANDLVNSFNAPTSAKVYASKIRLNENLIGNDALSADHSMLSEGIYDTDIDLMVYDLPDFYKSSGYNVLVYAPNENYSPSKDSLLYFTINGQNEWLKLHPEEGWNWDGKYVGSTATTMEEAASGPGTNYFVIEDLTTDTVHIRTGNAKISGIQIITSNTKKHDQTIVFNTITDKLVSDTPFTLQASASSALFIDFEIVSGPASVAGNTITLDGTTGVVEIKAIQAGNDNYHPVEKTQSFNISDGNKEDQTITFNQIPNKMINDPEFKVVATSSASLPVTVEVVDGPATMINDSMISLTGGTGYVTLKATQEGNTTYNPAPMVLEKFKVTENAQPGITLSFPYPNTLFHEGNTITLNADVTLGSETLNVVEFYEGDTKLGEATDAPYIFDWEDVQIGSYSLSARLLTAEGTDIYSQFVPISVDQLMGMQAAGEEQLFLHPNPTTGKIMANLNSASISTPFVEVYTMQGKKIITQRINGRSALTIDLSDQSKGMYLVKVGSVVKKVIKQ